jgi:hypothetical protein
MTNPSDSPRPKIDDQLREMLKYLRLGHLLAHWEETLQQARQGRYSSERLLKYVVEEEYRAKRENARLLRRKRANIPEMWEMETFPFHKQPKLDQRRVMSLYDSFDYMTKRRGVIWLGPTGCGKTGLATAFLLQAIDRGYRGYFITFPELIQELFQASADRSDRKVRTPDLGGKYMRPVLGFGAEQGVGEHELRAGAGHFGCVEMLQQMRDRSVGTRVGERMDADLQTLMGLIQHHVGILTE